MNAEKAAQIYHDAMMDCAYGTLVDEMDEQQGEVERLQSELAAAQKRLSGLHEARAEMVGLDDSEEPYEAGLRREAHGPPSASVHLKLVKPEDSCVLEPVKRKRSEPGQRIDDLVRSLVDSPFITFSEAWGWRNHPASDSD